MTWNEDIWRRCSDIQDLYPLNPSILPASFGPTWYPSGWHTKFAQPDYDAALSTLVYEQSRAYICPRRSHWADYIGETWDNGFTGWSDISSGSGLRQIVNLTNGDPAIWGPALDLRTGLTHGSLAGSSYTIGYPIGDNFGAFIVFDLVETGITSGGALHFRVQNNSGKTLAMRSWENATEVYSDGAWRTLGNWPPAGNGQGEAWYEVNDAGSGQHTVQLYLGTKKWGSPYTGALPFNWCGANNTVWLLQDSSGGQNGRHSQISQFAIGPTQLCDDMIFVSPKLVVPAHLASPTCGHIKVLFENVSNDVTTSDLLAFISKDDGVVGSWQPIPLTDYGVSGCGVLDNPVAEALTYAGSANLTGSGKDIRIHVKSINHRLPAVKGITAFWNH